MSEHRLDKILIERPRGGFNLKTKEYRVGKTLSKYSYESPEYESLRPCNKGAWRITKTKYFSDHLSPLRRWLRSQVGQPWDKVYSQICRQLESRTLSGQHILFHLWNLVERDVVIINGLPYRKHQQEKPINSWYDCFYIHPETGFLCVVEKTKKSPKRQPKKIIDIDSYFQYRLLNNFWYSVYFEDIYYHQLKMDILLNKNLDYERAKCHYGKPIYADRKYQCSKRDLKAIDFQLRLAELKNRRPTQ